MSEVGDDTYVAPVLLLCASCGTPIKAWINSSQWIRCEWVSPSGECQECERKGKERNLNDERDFS